MTGGWIKEQSVTADFGISREKHLWQSSKEFKAISVRTIDFKLEEKVKVVLEHMFLQISASPTIRSERQVWSFFPPNQSWTKAFGLHPFLVNKRLSMEYFQINRESAKRVFIYPSPSSLIVNILHYY